MFLDSSPDTARRSVKSRRASCHKPARQIAAAGTIAESPRPVSAPARPRRLDDAIVSQWLLDQLPSDHRHAFGSASSRRALVA